MFLLTEHWSLVTFKYEILYSLAPFVRKRLRFFRYLCIDINSENKTVTQVEMWEAVSHRLRVPVVGTIWIDSLIKLTPDHCNTAEMVS